jgi:putative flavoprotein involved in K+ transport
MTTTQPAAAGEYVDTLIIGGGQAGLALGYHLSRQGRQFLILDAYPRVGDAWRRRWDSLRLFTPAKYDGLPGLRFPGSRLSFPTKDELADYLESYAAELDLPVQTGVRVEALSHDGENYVVASGDRRWRARNVVVATGASQIPRQPSYAGELSADIRQLHSVAYRKPEQLQPGPVLVVGMGNSGAEIALELSRTHQTFIAGQPGGELPVRHGAAAALFVLPIVRFAGLHVLNLDTPVGRKVAPQFLHRAAPLIRTKRKDLERAGVTVVPRVIGVRNGLPMVDGGETLEVANVVWSTGFRLDYSWIELPASDVFDADGRPRQRRGVVETSPGLYFLGLHFLYAAASETLPGTSRDAKHLARQIEAGSTADTTAHRATDALQAEAA